MGGFYSAWSCDLFDSGLVLQTFVTFIDMTQHELLESCGPDIQLNPQAQPAMPCPVC